MRTGAIILCGGRSARMGRDKALLPFGPETMLQRVVRIVGEVIADERIVVVAGPRQILPGLPKDVIVARDTDEHLGPLAGLAAGLQALSAQAGIVDAVYATGCDFPLVAPAFIERMLLLLEEHDAAVPAAGGEHHVLAAVYRPRALRKITALLATGQLRLQSLLAEITVRDVGPDELRAVDPSLDSLRNVNSDQEYKAALAAAGICDE